MDETLRNWVAWTAAIGLVGLVAFAGSALVLRLRRQILEKPGSAGEDREELLETLLEAYLEGELNADEYEQLKQKIRGTESEQPPPRGRGTKPEPGGGGTRRPGGLDQ